MHGVEQAYARRVRPATPGSHARLYVQIRAGEAAKGFAVVVTEVKTLAGQTATATEQVSTNGTSEVSRNIAGVSRVAKSSGKTAAVVLEAAQAVSAQAGEVRTRVESFVRQIQAA